MQQKKTFSNILIAVSGGADSMFLATFMIRMFQEYHIPMKHLFFVHCNHKTRPETDQEELFIRDYFAAYQLFVVEKPDSVPMTEKSLRERRYKEWKSLMEEYNIEQLFLGHHFDDRVETTMLNLLRGCGLTGFLGIKTKESHHLLGGRQVVRPLLAYRKQQILDRCTRWKIPYVVDQTNFDATTSQRNKMRLEYLPSLFAQKGFEQTMRTIYIQQEQNQNAITLLPIQQSPYRYADRAYELQINQSEITTEFILRLLKQLHASSGVTSGTIQELWKFLATNTDGWKYIQGISFFVAHGKLYAIKAAQGFRQKTIDNHQQIPTSGEIVRYPKPGDRYKGKTRNKYCINQKIPLFRRNFVQVVEKDGKIVKVKKEYLIVF